MDENERVYVTVELDRYDQLIETETKFWIMLDTIMKTSKLSWNRRDLSYDDDVITILVKCFYGGMLDKRVKELRQEAGIKNDDEKE